MYLLCAYLQKFIQKSELGFLNTSKYSTDTVSQVQKILFHWLFEQSYQSRVQSFMKIGAAVLEKTWKNNDIV